MSKGLVTLPQILGNNGYNTTCVNYGGFKGFDTHSEWHRPGEATPKDVRARLSR